MCSPFFKYLLLALSLIGAIFLSWEPSLVLHTKSICLTAACEAVGSYLRIDASLLTAGGAVFFWLLSLLLYFTLHYPARLQNIALYVLALALALAIDSSLIGVQVFSIRQYCQLYIAVAAVIGSSVARLTGVWFSLISLVPIRYMGMPVENL